MSGPNAQGASPSLSLRRVGQLFLRELAHGYRGLLIALAASAAGILVVAAVGALAMSAGGAPAGMVRGDAYVGFYRLLLFVGGLIVTSLAFREVWQPGSGIAYLTLPGSRLEKLAVKLLLTSVGYAAATLIAMSAISAASEALDRLVFGVGRGFFNPFSNEVLQAAARYLVVQSFFLLGSIWFRKLAFLKTVLALMLIGVLLAILAAIALRLGLGPHLSSLGARGGGMRFGGGFQLYGSGLQDLFTPGSRGYVGANAFKIAGEALFLALAPASWVAAYFRLGEAEV